MIQFENAGLRYGHSRNEVIKDLTINFQKGNFYYLTGPSGSGKSTLIKLMYAAIKPTRGYVRIFNNDVVIAKEKIMSEVRRKIGVVFQDFRLINDISVYDNIALPLRISGKSTPEAINTQVLELLTWINLKDYKNALPPTLSGGQQQSVAIARAIIAQPDILLADEPTGSLDSKMSEQILEMVMALHKSGTTIIFATHNRDIINRFPHPELTIVKGNVKEVSHG